MTFFSAVSICFWRTASSSWLLELAFAEVGKTLAWEGEGVEERGIDRETGRTLVQVDPRYFRPTEVEQLLGDATKAREVLGWTYRTSFRDLVSEMVREDLSALKRGDHHRDHDS